MALQGVWFDGKTSASRLVELRLDDHSELSVVDVDSQQIIIVVPFSLIRISSRVGNTARYIYFPGGEKCETKQHDLVDQWLHQYRPSFWNNLAHQLETHTYFVALTVALVAAFTWAIIVYGLPATSRYIAYKLPQGVMNAAANETLEFLDKTQFNVTELDKETRTQLLKDFAPAINQNKNLHINVIFRHGGAIGANAFALPDGTVVFTDEIVQLAKNHDELVSVLAHEIGHVKYRHALRSVIQGSVISFGVAMVTGDLSAGTSLLAGLPAVMTNMSYSRNFEREADDNSLVFLDANHIERHHFVDLMERLTYHAECSQLVMQDKLKYKIKSKISSSSKKIEEDIDQDDDLTGENEDEDLEADDAKPFDVEAHRPQCDKLIADYKDNFFHSKLLGYFASHPATDERTKKFKAQPAVVKERTH